MEQDAPTLPRAAPNSGRQVKHHLESTVTSADKETPADLICFSHLRWHFVYQRPQHLMSRFAHTMRVFFFEEPVVTERKAPFLEIGTTPSGVTVVVPQVPAHLDNIGAVACQRKLLDELCDEYKIRHPILWYYTPMSGAFSAHLGPSRVVYDCMDELSGFRAAPPDLLQQEQNLFRRADVVFTGGYSLYEAKRQCHPNVHAFPSSIDADHFRRARGRLPEPADQAPISRPRIGHYAVLDERLDTALLDEVAKARPNWEFILVGPVVKIDPAELPKRANIHYLGPKRYDALPAYLAGWDMAMMPFALNEATRFISPTKTPEYLAAGKPVVSTPITDVVHSYGDTGLVRIARDPAEFVAAIDQQLSQTGRRGAWLKKVDRALQETSWDRTWAAMKALIA